MKRSLIMGHTVSSVERGETGSWIFHNIHLLMIFLRGKSREQGKRHGSPHLLNPGCCVELCFHLYWSQSLHVSGWLFHDVLWTDSGPPVGCLPSQQNCRGCTVAVSASLTSKYHSLPFGQPRELRRFLALPLLPQACPQKTYRTPAGLQKVLRCHHFSPSQNCPVWPPSLVLQEEAGPIFSVWELLYFQHTPVHREEVIC